MADDLAASPQHSPEGSCDTQQMRLAIPINLFPLYKPTALRSIASRDTHLFKRIVIGLLMYATFTTAYFLTTFDSQRS